MITAHNIQVIQTCSIRSYRSHSWSCTKWHVLGRWLLIRVLNYLLAWLRRSQDVEVAVVAVLAFHSEGRLSVLFVGWRNYWLICLLLILNVSSDLVCLWLFNLNLLLLLLLVILKMNSLSRLCLWSLSWTGTSSQWGAVLACLYFRLYSVCFNCSYRVQISQRLVYSGNRLSLKHRLNHSIVTRRRSWTSQGLGVDDR